MAHASVCELPVWAVLRSREEFNRPGLPLLTVKSASGVSIREASGGRPPSEDLSGYRVVRAGDLVVNRLWARFGAYGVSPTDGIISPAYWVLRQSDARLHSGYLHHLLRSAPYLAEIGRLSKNMPPNGFDLPWDLFRLMRLQVPPLDEQVRIADVLDSEIAAIDALVETKRSLVARLEERVDSLIRQRIAGSALADARLGTEVVPVKRLLAKMSRRPPVEGQMITAFRDGQVTARGLRRAEGYTESWTEGGNVQGVRVNDVVVHGLDGFAGAIGTAEVDGVCSPVYHVCELRADGDPNYLGRMLRLLAVSGYLSGFAVSTRERAYDFRNWGLFGAIPVPLVDPSEQQEVGVMLGRIKPLRMAVEASAALVDEHRNSLINTVVNGEHHLPAGSGRTS